MSKGVDFLANVGQNTWFHILDPRTKLFFLITLIIVDLFFLDPRYLFVVFLSTVPFWIIARVKLRPLLPQLTGIALFLFSLMFFVFSFSGSIAMSGHAIKEEGGILIEIGPLAMTLSAARIGAVQILRMAIPMVTSLLVFSTTDPVMFARGLTKLKIPYEISFMLLGALRLLPLVLEESANIADAQRIRGVNTRGPVNRIKATNLLLFPLFVNTLRKARALGLAVECKAFGARAWHSYLREVRFERRDYLMMAWTITFATILLYIRLVMGLGWGWII